MAFKLLKNRTFTTKATFSVPTDGGHEEQDITVRFRVLSDAEAELPVVEFLATAIVHVDGVQDDDGEIVLSSPNLIAELVAIPFARVGLMKAYWQALAGARAGN